jgi:hypothetical protein
MTINKMQGQTMKIVGIYLPKLVFTHNQLYVTLSRATHVNDIFVFCPDGKTTTNVVYTELLQWSFFSIWYLFFFSRWVEIPTSKSRVEIPYIGCKNGYNGTYVHDVQLLKIECFLNSYCLIEQKLSQLKIVK